MELNCTLALNAVAEAQQSHDVALDAREVEGQAVPMGITVLLAQRGETVWDLAKRFRVPTEELERMNPELAAQTAYGKPAQVMVFKR